MTKTFFKTALAAVVLSLTACSGDEGQHSDSPQYITISTGITDLTRAADNSRITFQEGDKVSIYAWTGKKDINPPQSQRAVDNAVNTLNASGTWVATPQMLWGNPDEKHYFVGRYPHKDTPIADLTADPYTLDTHTLHADDLILALRDDGVTPTPQPVDLTFKHAMAYMIVELSYGDQWGIDGPTVDKLTMKNVATSGTINYLKQEAVPGTAREDIEMQPTNPNWQYVTRMFPQSGLNTIVISIEGKDYTYTHPSDFTCTAGHITSIRLKVGRDKVTFGSMSITGWEVNDAVYSNVNGFNQAGNIKDRDKLDMIYSLNDLEGYDGRIYELNYTADYMLDEALQIWTKSADDMTAFVRSKLFDRTTSYAPRFDFGAGCSAFAADDPSTGHHLMGRNYDFYHKAADGSEAEIAAIVVHTAPAGGKRAVSVVDSYWLGMKRGFFTDGRTDLSMIMAAPYAFMDGINEDGFAIGVLHLGGKPTRQDDNGKDHIYMNVAMRLLLDRAADVDEAVALLNNYNMHMESPAGGSFHFFMADAKGKYAIVEYVSESGDTDENPWKIDVHTGDDKYRYVTNFYVSPYMKDTPDGFLHSQRGKDRYDHMESILQYNGYKLTADGTMSLLSQVSQAPDPKQATSHTQWSSVYDLSSKSLTLQLLREYGVKKPFEFRVK